MKLTKALLLALILTLPLMAEARLLHIIHTNDLHSYFQGYRDGRGGYARLKAKIRALRVASEQQNIEVLQLDAGDFGEGTSFFLSQEGAVSLKALGMLGTDVAVIGNHDHMMGGKILGQQIRRANVKTQFISGNLIQTPEMELGGLVKPYVDINKGGISIRVIGLSTAEAHFQYPLLPGFILPPVQVGEELAQQARKQNKELVIALTHIGQNKDVDLARKSTEIDLIVGGHSHDRIEEVRWEKNKKGKKIPIVQAGSHGLVVGDLLLDIKEDGTIEVLRYELHEIKEPMAEDPAMASLVAEATEDRNQYFGGRWDEVIGETLIPLSGTKNGKNIVGETCWGEHMAKMSREAVGADLAIHLAQFEGHSKEPGLITFGDLIDNFPHFRNYGDPGWEIATITVKGKVLKILLKAIINLKDLGVNFHGVTYKQFKIPACLPFLGGKQWSFRVRINGEKIYDKGTYTIAFPAEVGHALQLTLPEAAKEVFPGLTNSGVYYWKVMEDYVRANTPIQCLSDASAKSDLGPEDAI